MMSTQDFDLRLRHIDEQYAAKREGAEAYRDQEVSRLFVECGWKKVRIAEHMGKTHQWVGNRLLFGCFMAFATARCVSEFDPRSLTEWRFRNHWLKVSKGPRKETEEGRFARVLDSLRADAVTVVPPGYANLVNKPGLKAAVVEALKAGPRRTTAELAAVVSEKIPETTAKQVTQAIKAISKSPPKGYALDTRATEKAHRHRLVPSKGGRPGPGPQPIDPAAAAAVVAGVMPKLKYVIEMLKRDRAERSIATAVHTVWEVEQALAALVASGQEAAV